MQFIFSLLYVVVHMKMSLNQSNNNNNDINKNNTVQSDGRLLSVIYSIIRPRLDLAFVFLRNPCTFLLFVS